MESKTRKHVCALDGRCFSTKQALDQHRRDAHSASVGGGARGRSRRGRARSNATRTRTTRIVGVDVAPSRTRAAPSGAVTVTGEDRLGMFTVETNGKIFQDYLISAGASLRLSAISKAFQRIKWDLLEIRVVPQASLVVSGGYVCGFVMDPDDKAVTAGMLTSTQNSITKKWYETAVVRMPPKGDWLYTSSGEEPRLYSPGVFWIISEGNPSVKTNVVITMNWRVSLKQPTVEHESDMSLTLPGRLYPIQSNYNVEMRMHKASGSDETTTDFSQYVNPQLLTQSGYHFFRVPSFTVEYKEGTGDTGTAQMHYVVFYQEDKKMYYSSDGENISKTTWQGDVATDQCLVPCNTILRYEGQGNACKGYDLKLQSLPSSNSRSLKSSLQQLIESLNQTTICLQKSSKHLSRNLQRTTSDLQTYSSSSSLEHLGQD